MIYVVTAVHNRCSITKRFVLRLKEQTNQRFRLILVDDGCIDNTVEEVLKELPTTTILKGNGNLYWGGALQLAYKWLVRNGKDNNMVWIANDDTEFPSNYLEKAEKLIRENPQYMITGCGYSIHTREQIDGVIHWDLKKGGIISKLQANDLGNCASTRSLFFTIKQMKKVGGFHPILLPHYGSDYEWTLRAYRKGILICSFSELSYQYDEFTTGDNDLQTLTLKQLFSRRSIRNPIYRLCFVLLSTPMRYLPSHIAHQLGRYVKKANIFFEIVRRKRGN